MSNGCKDCFNGCGPWEFDKCVKYTGDDIAYLDICNGDTLDKVLNSITDKLSANAVGDDITPDIVLCSFVNDILDGEEATLNNILEAFSDGLCELDDRIDDLTGGSFSFDTSCLDVPDDATLNDVVQANLLKTCELDTAVDSILEDYVKSSELNVLIEEYLESSESDAQQYTKMVPYVAYEYYGPLTNFDSTGKGLNAAGFSKVYICNGDNGTPDKRGRVGVGCNVGVPGGSLDSSVDPTVSGNYQITLKHKVGKFKHPLVVNELASHGHAVSDPGHRHPFQMNENGTGNSNTYPAVTDNVAIPKGTGNTTNAVTNITVASTGGNQAHNNTQPSIGANFIMYLP